MRTKISTHCFSTQIQFKKTPEKMQVFLSLKIETKLKASF